jgi:DNA-binding beta-propeller fold protein YncE
VWWISYRGEGRSGLDNIGVFEDDGRPRARHPLLLNPSARAKPLHIPRGFALAGDDLYIANAWRRDSHVAHYRRDAQGGFRYAGMLLTSRQAPALVHPFDIDLGDDGRLYMSNQDTNTVIALDPATRRHLEIAPHLRSAFPDADFLPGTVVASSQGRLPDVRRHQPADVPAPQGLEVVLDVHGKPRHSVRGIVAARGHLYVADEAGDAVKVFELASGRLVARIKGKRMKKPVHLVLHQGTLYIGAAGSGCILAYTLGEAPPAGKIKPRTVIDGKLQSPSGFAIGPDGDLYVAERLHQRVRRFGPDGQKKGVFIDALPDMPEFLVHVPDRA